MSDAALPDPTALDKGRDDKALADAFKVLAAVIDKLAAAPPPAPVPPPGAGPSTDISKLAASNEQLARAVLAFNITRLPQVLVPALNAAAQAHAAGGKGPGKGDPVSRLAAAGPQTVLEMGRLLAARFRAALGPLAVFAQTVDASNSGMNVLQKSAKVLAATLAPVVLPVAVLLAAGLLELSDSLDHELKPAITEWTRVVLANKDGLLQFARALAQTIGWLTNPSGKTTEATKTIDEGRASQALLAGKTRQQFEKELEDTTEIRFLRTIGMNETAEGRKAANLIAFDELRKGLGTAPGVPPGVGSLAPRPKPRTSAPDPLRDELLTPMERTAKRAILSGQSREQYLAERAADDGAKGVSPDLAAAYQNQYAETFDNLVKDMGDLGGAAKEAAEAIRAGVSREQFRKNVESSEAFTAAGPEGNTYLVRRLAEFDAQTNRAKADAAGESGSWLDRRVTALGGKPGAEGGSAAARGRPSTFGPRDVLADVMQSLRMSILPQASIGSLEGVGRQVQLKALQSDPLDARLLDITTKSVDRLDSIIGELKGLRGDMTTPAKKGTTAAPPVLPDGTKPR